VRFFSKLGAFCYGGPMRVVGVALSGALFVVGCLTPPPSQRVAEVAREVNIAARFGRMDLALEHTDKGARRHFAAHRSQWGGPVRVLDLELGSLSMQDSENAVVFVDIQWSRPEESTLHATRIEQTWRGGADDHGWVLVRERRVSGDLGLFGERIVRAEPPEPHDDVQFATKTIR
jgi:hypothetical protein